MITRLGAHNVSSMLLVEAWKEKGRECDDVFFMHFDVLYSYQFLKQADECDKPLGLEQLLTLSGDQDRFITITDEGREFLHRFGGV